MIKPRPLRTFTAFLLLIALAQPAMAGSAPPANDSAILARLVDYLKRQKVHPDWPGYNLSSYPLVYAIGESYYLVSAPERVALQWGSKEIPTLPGVKRLAPDTVHRLALATDQVWDEKHVDGEPVYVVKQMAEAHTAETLDPIHEFLTLLHETFHFTVQTNFMHRFAQGDERFLDATDFAYTQVEASLLARLLEEQNPGRLREGVQLYLAVREMHEGLIPKAYADYRQGLTVDEGTAQYLTDVFLKRTHPADSKNHLAYSIPRLKAALSRPQAADRDRYYVVGAAACHLLDRLMPRWKERFSDYVDSLDGLLAEAVGYNRRSEATLRQLGGRYGIDKALSRHVAQYKAIAEKEAKEIEGVLNAYGQQGSSQLTVMLPPLNEAAQGGTWAESWDLPGDRKLRRARRFEVTQRETKKSVLSLADGVFITNYVAGRTMVELYRNLTPEEIRVNGLPFSTDAATGSLEVTQKGFLLRAQEATIKRMGRGYQIDIIKP